MDEQYGAEGGELLRRVLADMRAAGCLGDVPLLALSVVPARLGGEVKYDVGVGLTLVLKANHQKPPKLRGGGIDWPLVDRILIERIERTHD